MGVQANVSAQQTDMYCNLTRVFSKTDLVFLATFVAETMHLMLRHFLAYYVALGVPPSRISVFVHTVRGGALLRLVEQQTSRYRNIRLQTVDASTITLTSPTHNDLFLTHINRLLHDTVPLTEAGGSIPETDQ